MRDKDVKNKLIQEIEKQTPNVLDNILQKCEDKEIVMKKEKQKRSMFLPLSVALASILLLVGITGFTGYNILYKTNAIIELDVNPSIEIKVNSKRKITQATALNKDGEKILNGMDLKNSDLNVGVNAIIGSMLKEGYISDLKNSILVSVNSKNKVEAGALQKQLSSEIDKILKAYSINSSVVTQRIDLDDQVEQKAKEAGISEGKAEYIEKIIEDGLTNKNGEKYTFETLSKLTINELNVILNSKNKTVRNTTTTGEASTKSYIGVSKAKSIALSNAGVSESSTRDMEVELDYENGKMIYEVSFDANCNEYEYDIDAITGSIITKEIERDDYCKTVQNNTTTRPSNSSNSNTSSSSSSSNRPSTSSSSNSSSSSSSSSNNIGATKAKSIALSNAGVSNPRELEVEFDSDDGVYEVSFKSGNKEYNYEIDAKTGRIVSKDIEIDD